MKPALCISALISENEQNGLKFGIRCIENKKDQNFNERSNLKTKNLVNLQKKIYHGITINFFKI